MRTQRRVRSGAALAAAMALLAGSACDDTTTAILDDPRDHSMEAVARIEISAPSAAIQVGDITRLQASLYCPHDIEVFSVEPVWTALTPEFATVDATGRVEGMRPGGAVVQASVAGVHHDHMLRVDPYGRTIGRAGGDLAWHEGAVHVIVPSGALDDATLLTVTDMDEPLLGAPGASTFIPGSAHSFGPDGIRFLNPVELHLAYQASELPPGTNELRLRIHRLAEGRWLPLASSTVDPEAGVVSATTWTFSTYGLFDYRPEPGSVVVEPYENLLAVGGEQRLTASIADASGVPIVAPDVTWTSSDPDVATVDADGNVVAVGPGWATITASSGPEVGDALFAVRAPATRASVTPAEFWLAPGESAHPTLHLEDESGAPLHQSADWVSGDESIVTVAPDGTVRAVAFGEAVVRVESGGATAELTVHVTPAPASILITPAAGYYPVGDTIRFTAHVLDAAGDEIERPVRWVASEPPILVAPGLLRATRPTIVLLTASTGDVNATTVLTFVDAADLPGSIELAPSPVTLQRGEAVQVTATVRDRLGVVIEDAPVTWASGNPAVATVDPTGLVMAVQQGTTLLTARTGRAAAVAEIVVVAPGQRGPPNTVAIWPRSPWVGVGGSAQIFATVYDDEGNAIPDATVLWSSDDPGVFTVNESGLITGVAEGASTLHATSGARGGSMDVTVGHEDDGSSHEEGLGNNLSWPVIFTEGYGMTGLPVSTDPGIRPTIEEGIEVTELPFFAPVNAADYFAGGTDYYLQKGTNTWRAEWDDGAAEIQSAEVKWGDNLTHHTFSTHSMIRVETSLALIDGTDMTGFNMTSLYGSRSTEMQGTDGTTAPFVPGLYSVTARLRIEKLDEATMEPIFTAFDGNVAEGMLTEGPGSYGAEVNVAGRIIYGFNFRVRDVAVPSGIEKYGWWRLTFSLDDAVDLADGSVARGLSLDRCGNAADGDEELTYTPVLDTSTQTSTLDIWIASASGGGGGGSGGHTDGSTSGHTPGGGSSGGGCGGH